MSKTYKILLVEDEPDIVQIFGSALRRGGFKVEAVIGGKDALEKIKKAKFDLILLDLVIPEIDGYEVLRQLKKNRATKNIPVYVWSNLAQNGEIARAEKLDVDGYLVKTDYTPTKLAEKVREILF